MLEKDYALGYLLAGMARVPELRDVLVLKGGMETIVLSVMPFAICASGLPEIPDKHLSTTAWACESSRSVPRVVSSLTVTGLSPLLGDLAGPGMSHRRSFYREVPIPETLFNVGFRTGRRAPVQVPTLAEDDYLGCQQPYEKQTQYDGHPI
jgi:hypothetical protein